MPPASAELTLTAAQEKEDNRSHEQAAKAGIKSTGNKIYQNCLPANNMITFFVCFKEIQKFVFLSILRFGFGGCIQLSIQCVPTSGCKIVYIHINIRSEVYT